MGGLPRAVNGKPATNGYDAHPNSRSRRPVQRRLGGASVAGTERPNRATRRPGRCRPPGARLSGRDAHRPRAHRRGVDRPWPSRHAVAAPCERRSGRRRALRPLARRSPNAVPNGSFTDRIDGLGRGRPPDRRRSYGTGVRGHASLAHGCFHHLRPGCRVGVVPDHHARHSSPPASGPSPRKLARERELPVRAYGGVDRRLLRARAPADLDDQKPRFSHRGVERRRADPRVRGAVTHVSRDASPARHRGWSRDRHRQPVRPRARPAAQSGAAATGLAGDRP